MGSRDRFVDAPASALPLGTVLLSGVSDCLIRESLTDFHTELIVIS